MRSETQTRVPFRQAVDDTTGGQPKVQRRDYQREGDVPVIDQGQEVIAGFTAKDNAYSGPLPVVLFGDHTRAFKYVDFPFALGADGVKVLSPREGFDAAFLYFYFRSIRLPNAGYSRHFKFLREIDVPRVPLAEQRQIVDILSRADGLVRLRREAEAKVKAIIPALFTEMFGDPATNPKGWPMRPLSEVAKVGSGNGFPTALQGRTVGSFPFYKVSDMNEVGNEVEMVRANNYIDDDVREKLRATVFPPGTVVFPKIGAAIATNKKRLLTLPSCVDNNVGAIVPTGEILPTYLHALIMAKNLSDFASDSNPPSIRKTTVEQWQIPVPPMDAQTAFAEQRAAMIAVDQQQRVAFQCAENIFAALLSRTFSAETI